MPYMQQECRYKRSQHTVPLILNGFTLSIVFGLYFVLLVQNLSIMVSKYKLKSAISVGTVMTLLLGISLLYLLVYVIISFNITSKISPQFRTTLLIVLLCSSFFLILSSIAGIYGFANKQNVCVMIHALTILIYFVTFILLAVGLFKTESYLAPDCTDSLCQQYTATVQFANATLCRRDCLCFFPNYRNYSVEDQKAMEGLNWSEEMGSRAVRECVGWNGSMYPLASEIVFFEQYFECAGWDQSSLYYFFSDVNRGKPRITCAQALRDLFKRFGIILQIACVLVSLVLLLILLAVGCLCCKRQQQPNYDALKLFQRLIFVNLPPLKVDQK